MTITLIGYRCSGKSTVGPLLAERLRMKCVDSDQLIADRQGRSISEIFACDGESGFRRIEADIIAEILRTQVILAAGGGAVLNEDTVRRMQSAGPVVWLQVSAEEIRRRLNTDPATAGQRPGLTGSSASDEIENVLADRLPIYRRAATLVVNAEDRTPEQITDEIMARTCPEHEESAQ